MPSNSMNYEPPVNPQRIVNGGLPMNGYYQPVPSMSFFNLE